MLPPDDRESAPAWRRGIVTALRSTKCQAKVRFPDEDGLVSKWLPICVPFALGAKAYWLPRVGSQVVALIDEHGEDGVIMGAIYSDVDTPPVDAAKTLHIVTEDGTKVEIDPEASIVTVDTPGKIIAKAGGDINATAGGHINGTAGASSTFKAPQVTVDAPLSIFKGIVRAEGVIQADAGITTSSGGSIPGTLTVAGRIKSDSDLYSSNLSFNAHVHTEQGDGADTSTPH